MFSWILRYVSLQNFNLKLTKIHKILWIQKHFQKYSETFSLKFQLKIRTKIIKSCEFSKDWQNFK